MKEIVLAMFMAGYITSDQLSTGLDIAISVEKVSVMRSIDDVGRCNPELRPVVTDHRFIKFMSRWLKPMLISLAYAESKFKFKRGLYDRDDIGYFQINRRYWDVDNVREILCYHISTEKAYYDPYIGAQVAARILIYNIAMYMRINGRGHAVWRYALSYRNLSNDHPISYIKNVQKILFKYDNMK